MKLLIWRKVKCHNQPLSDVQMTTLQQYRTVLRQEGPSLDNIVKWMNDKTSNETCKHQTALSDAAIRI